MNSPWKTLSIMYLCKHLNSFSLSLYGRNTVLIEGREGEREKRKGREEEGREEREGKKKKERNKTN